MYIKQFFIDLKLNICFVCKWLWIAFVLGIVCGIVGALFHISIDYVTNFRLSHSWIVWGLPIGGVCIVYLYRLVHLSHEPGTNTIIQSIRQQEKVPVLLAPAIFLATIITHLFGGSSGREGAALQIGGSLATSFGKIIHADQREMSMLIMCGMSAVFSALFGTPLTATLFSMEVVSVGVFYYAALVPCLCSSLISFGIAQLFGCQPTFYQLSIPFQLTPIMSLKLAIFAFIIAAFSIVFVLMMHYSHKCFHQYFHNPYIRVIMGSFMLMVLVFFFQQRYLGAGMEIVAEALYHQALPYDFFMKAIFTAITIGCGFKGGEIVPTFVIGSTLGYVSALLLGIDSHLGAAIGIVGMFCCVINSPLTSLMLGAEMFGIQYLTAMAIVVALCYVLSGYFSLYQAQKIVYSKTSVEFINQNAK